MNVEFSCKTHEWYTPAEICESVRTVLGSIDLDPASCEFANQTVQAQKIFTEEENGIWKLWHGNVFLNPPSGVVHSPSEYGAYGSKSKAIVFWNKLLYEFQHGSVENAIYLGVSSKLLHLTPDFFDYPLCITCSNHSSTCITGSGRIRFVSSEGKVEASPAHGNFFVLLTHSPDMVQSFRAEFSKYGVVLTP